MFPSKVSGRGWKKTEKNQSIKQNEEISNFGLGGNTKELSLTPNVTLGRHQPAKFYLG